jgi:acyl-CoA synthetase (AMP-forming)/AMP-acid ligase II
MERLEANTPIDYVIHSATRPWRGTFGDVLDLSRRVAAGLAELGVEAGDVVTFQTPNWIEGVVTFYGAALIGAVVAPVVHLYGTRELSYILGECKPRVHVTAPRFGRQDYLANLAAAADLPPIDVVVTGDACPDGFVPFDQLASTAPVAGPTVVDPACPALVGWTSGTTANPKGVIHSHQSALAEVRQLSQQAPPDRPPTLMANPISHAIGMLGALLIPVEVGKAVHLLDQWDPAVVLRLMLEEDLTTGGGAPYFLTSLLDHPDFTDAHLERLSIQGMGGAPVPQAVAERATNLGITVYRSYGSTEHPSITGCRYSDAASKRLHTDGIPLPGNEIRLVDPDGKDVDVGQPGQILSRGPELFLGYTDPDLTAKAFDADGWYHTSDIAVMDEAGYIRITDRAADLIIRGGENISAAEVEELLLRMPGVAEVAVVAAPDERMGEHAAAVFRIIPGHPHPRLEDVRAHLEASGLARHKWPEELLVVDDFPRTASAKVQKYLLRGELRKV